MNIQTSTVNKICILPGIGTVIGVGTIASNILKSIADVARINFLKLGVAYYSVRRFTPKKLQKQAQLRQAQADLVQHVKFIAIGILRLVPVLGGFILYSHDAYTQQQENKLRRAALLQHRSLSGSSFMAEVDSSGISSIKLEITSDDKLEPKPKDKAPEVKKNNKRRKNIHKTTLLKMEVVDQMEQLKLKAAAGEVQALIKLGHLYYNGQGVEQSYEESLKYYLQAAEKGNAEAQNHAAYMFRRRQGIASMGMGNTEADEQALHWTRKAADQGLDMAQYNLGNLLRKGIATKINVDEAIDWYTKAANSGFKDAFGPLAEILDEKKEYIKAIPWYHKAVESGNVDAMQNLAKLYRYGLGIDRSTEEAANIADKQAFKLTEQAALRNVSEAQHTLGNLYQKGVGTEISETKAFEWYLKAANSGLLLSKRQVVSMLKAAVNKDIQQILKWLKSIAVDKTNNSEDKIRDIGSIFRLGLKLEKGEEGYPKNGELAIECYKLAAELGHVVAEILLGKMYCEGTNGITLSPQTSLAIFQKHINNDPLAKYYLAKMYADNKVRGVDNPVAEATRLYLEAARTKDFPKKNSILSFQAAKNLVDKNHSNPLAKYYLANAYAAIGRERADLTFLANAENLYLEAAKMSGLSDSQVVDCYKGARELGSTEASFALFTFYLKEEKGLVGTPEKAFDLMDQLEDVKYHQRLFDLTSEAAGKNCLPAIHQLGIWYMAGLEGVLDEPQIQEGEKLLKNAADQNYAPSIIMLIEIYSQTDNMTLHNLAKAVAWYKKAQEYEKAQENIGEKVNSSLLEQIDEIAAIESVKIAAAAN